MTKSAELKKDTGSTEQGMQSRSEKSLSAFDDMDSMFERFFSRPWGRAGIKPFQIDWPETTSAFQGQIPKVDVVDQDGDILVRAELPGVEKDDLNITLLDNAVTIRATTRHEEKEENESYYHRELSRGEYVRTVQMPTEVNADKVKASFKNGLLKLTLPKLKKSSRRSINVS